MMTGLPLHSATAGYRALISPRRSIALLSSVEPMECDFETKTLSGARGSGCA